MQAVSREQIDQWIISDAPAAVRGLRAFWREAPGPATAAFVVSRFEQLRDRLNLLRYRIAIVRSFTLEPLIPMLRADAFAAGLDLDVRLGDFGTWVQDLLDANGWLYTWNPDVVIVAAQSRDVAPSLWDGAPQDPGSALAAVRQTLAQFENAAATFRARSSANLLVHTMQVPTEPALGVLDDRIDSGQTQSFRAINQGLQTLSRAHRNLYLLDYDALVARRGHDAWFDARMWKLARVPIAAGEMIHLARQWMRFLHPLSGRICKALAVDLDNTLWGGVIGEDGIDGIKLGDAGVGAAFLELQRALVDLHRRGILLALCSKNNPAEALEALEKHPSMLLRAAHFSAMRINWSDKAGNLREIAAELNIGLDAIAFLDDSAAERQWVSEQLPAVAVIDLPADPARYAAAVRDCPLFERLDLTDEDRQRGRLYAERRLRDESAASAASLEDFYRSLGMIAHVSAVNDRTLARAAQLTQKTNQFNLTTRRRGEQELAALLADPAWRAFTIQVADRFGDHGIVGLAVLHFAEGVCEIDTFLLSCRVIGRTVETAFASAIAGLAQRAGAAWLTGWYRPTAKNAPAQDFYAKHDFDKAEESQGASRWRLGLAAKRVSCPSWIDLNISD